MNSVQLHLVTLKVCEDPAFKNIFTLKNSHQTLLVGSMDLIIPKVFSDPRAAGSNIYLPPKVSTDPGRLNNFYTPEVPLDSG
jgi:hypothetical protein